MTVISVNADWEYAGPDETVGANAVAGLNTLRRKSGAGSTVYTTVQLYSDVAAAVDEFQAMAFKNIMLPVTPNAFTMEGKCFLPRRDIEFLKEGAVDADWTVNSNGGVWRQPYTVGVGTDFVDADIGRQVTESATGDTGTLLDFEVEPDGTLIAWIRPDDPATDLFDATTGTISVTGDSGTGSVDKSVAANSGLSRYSAIQAIGSVPAATEVYLYQNRFKMTDYLGNFQWWATDPDVSLGIVSILVRVRNAGTLIADGDVEVFARRYTSLYDNFRLNVSGGGFSALPLSSSPDINNTTGYRQITAQAGTGAGTFDVGNYIYTGASFATATKKGVITKVAGTTADPVVDYYLIGDLTDFANSDVVQEYDPVAGSDGDASMTASAPIAAPGGPTDATAGEGGTVTIALGGFAVDHDGDEVTEDYSIQVDAQGDVSVAKVYERMKYITRRGADEADLFGSGVNVPGEAYRGLDGIFEYDAATGTMTEGDDVTVDATGWTARLIHQNTGGSPTYIMVTDQQTSLNSIADNDVVHDEAGGDDVTIHAGGTIGIEGFTSPKPAPFGTFTGTVIFGARGVVYINSAAGDEQAYTLTDDQGNLRAAPNTVSVSVSNVAVGDRVLAARDTGVAGVIDKDQFGGLDTPSGSFNGLGDSVVQVAGSIDSEVPQSGWIRVVENSLQQEHKYYYDSRSTGANGQFTLRDPAIGTGVTTGSTTQLIDTSADFTQVGNEVLVGMLVRNTTVGKTTHVWEVTGVVDANTLDVRALYGPLDATQDWDSTDTYVINDLIGDHTVPGDYAATDDLFDLIIDDEVISGTQISNSFIKTPSADFGIVVNVRQGGVILPFTQNPTVSDNGASVTVVRTDDTIAI